MELTDLKNIWAQYDQKIERNWQLNMHLLRQTNFDKAKSQLSYVTGLNVVSLVISGSLMILYASFVYQNIQSIYFAAAGLILFCWTLLIAISAIEQLNIIHSIDYSAPVLEIQKRLQKLRLCIIRYLRLSILVLPLYMAHTLFWSKLLLDLDMVQVADNNWWLVQGAITLVVFVPLTIWLFRKLSPKYVHKRWMSKIISGSGGKQIIKAIDLLEEIRQFEKTDAVA